MTEMDAVRWHAVAWAAPVPNGNMVRSVKNLHTLRLAPVGRPDNPSINGGNVGLVPPGHLTDSTSDRLSELIGLMPSKNALTAA